VSLPRPALPTRARPAAAIGAAALVAAIAGVIVAFGPGSGPPDAKASARAAAERFLDRYVEGGRVVRRDQGGDTVSEGQAYALLLAVAAGDKRRFGAVWRWTRANLQRPDGLLSWRWAGGQVIDREAASDADLDAARALLLAARRFREPGYRAAAVRIGRGVLAGETEKVGRHLALLPGPWARGRGTINPSYFSPRAFAALAAATEDPRWRRLAASSRRYAGRLTERPPHLVPDWAKVAAWGVAPAGPPDRQDPPVHGFDAARFPIRHAESCERADRRLAARPRPVLRRQPAIAVRDLAGRALEPTEHPVALVAAAATARAAGDRRAAAQLLDRAEALDERSPTYYGAAWVALGRAMLTTDLLGGCR
jgi:endoglucanase